MLSTLLQMQDHSINSELIYVRKSFLAQKLTKLENKTIKRGFVLNLYKVMNQITSNYLIIERSC